jgi:hypothetical protein
MVFTFVVLGSTHNWLESRNSPPGSTLWYQPRVLGHRSTADFWSSLSLFYSFRSRWIFATGALVQGKFIVCTHQKSQNAASSGVLSMFNPQFWRWNSVEKWCVPNFLLPPWAARAGNSAQRSYMPRIKTLLETFLQRSSLDKLPRAGSLFKLTVLSHSKNIHWEFKYKIHVPKWRNGKRSLEAVMGPLDLFIGGIACNNCEASQQVLVRCTFASVRKIKQSNSVKCFHCRDTVS